MSIELRITRGLIAVVDDEDADLAQLNWCAHRAPTHLTFYAKRGWRQGGKQVSEYLHRVVAKRMGIDGSVDHKDRNGLNCRRSNLRQANKSQNASNSVRRKQSHSGYRGVQPDCNKWHARIKDGARNVYLGSFSTPEEAARAYDVAALRLFGEYATLNFPSDGKTWEARSK